MSRVRGGRSANRGSGILPFLVGYLPLSQQSATKIVRKFDRSTVRVFSEGVRAGFMPARAGGRALKAESMELAEDFAVGCLPRKRHQRGCVGETAAPLSNRVCPLTLPKEPRRE